MKQVDMTSKIANTLTLEILDNNFIPCDNINSHLGFFVKPTFCILHPKTSKSASINSLKS